MLDFLSDDVNLGPIHTSKGMLVGIGVGLLVLLFVIWKLKN